MGMFNHVRCRYLLPDPEAQNLEFQTKSMEKLFLDNYEITADGQLMHEAYETRFEEDAGAPLGFYINRENRRWEPADFTGELEMHTSVRHAEDAVTWYSYTFDFQNGRVVGLQHGPGHGQVYATGPSRVRKPTQP
jgi:hypothetical protein